mmetsp:Transcript_8508/g.12121  ORF Transcript_8508/g.12121 Transcript_8508/m.12121 type:complete len:192 (+) Transcript_8508:57-632(+)
MTESAIQSFVSGGVGGACALLVGHPFDLIKVRIQTASTASAASQASVFGMLRKTMVHEGIRGIYRGVSAPLVATTPIFAVSFWGYDMGKRIVRHWDNNNNTHGDDSNYKMSISQICVAGAISSFPTVSIVAPSERVKCLLQVQANEVEKGGKVKYNGMMDCVQQIYKEGGVRSVFKGTGVTLMRDIPGAVA